MTTNNYDVLIRFLLDQSSQQKTKAGVDQLTGDIGDVEKIVRAANKDFEQLEKQIKAASSVKELEKLERQLKDVDQQIKETTRSYSLQAKVLRSEAAAITDDFAKARVAQIKSISDRIGGASRTGLLAGGAVVGGILAEANRYAKEAEGAGKATQATREWTRATEELAQARARVDTVLLREALPLLKQAAKVANEAAAFVEKNPEIVSAALKTGEVLVALGAVGTAVTKGIRLYADVQTLALGAQQLQAAKLQDAAAAVQLKAARLRAGVEGVDIPNAPGPGSLVGMVSSVAVAVLAAGATAFAVKALIDKISPPGERDPRTAIPSFSVGGLGNAELRRKQVELANAISRHESPEKIAQLRAELKALGQQIFETAKQVRQGTQKISEAIQSGGLAGSAHETEIVSAFQQWKEEDARIVAEAAAQRVKITQDAEKQITASNAKLTKQITSINAGAQKRAESLTANFLKAETQDEAAYQKQRAQIIRDGGESIREIEADHQERLRKMTLDHGDRVEELTASRDALGLVKEQRRFNAEQAEEARSTRLEIAKRRQDLAERLAELDQEHQVEQAQRLAQFQEQLAENETQRKEQLKQAAAAHAEEMSQIRAQRAQQLRELAEGLNAERLRRREVFLAEIRDLDAALLGERALKQRSYQLMLQDATKFLADYRARLAGTTATHPDHDWTGYAMTGIYKMAANGVPEYVLSGAATKAAEQIIGGRLTQDAVLSALAKGTGNSSERSLTIGGNWRFDGRISASQVRAIKQEAVAELVKAIK